MAAETVAETTEAGFFQPARALRDFARTARFSSPLHNQLWKKSALTNSRPRIPIARRSGHASVFAQSAVPPAPR